MYYDIKDVIDFYLSSKNTNDTIIKYLRRCRLALLKFYALNHLFDLADKELVSKAMEDTAYYLSEAKIDRYYLRQIKKIMDEVYLHGVDKFEEDFAALIVCIEIKDKHISDLEEYYINKIRSHINNYGYPMVQDASRIDEYNGKMDTLVRKLQQ